MGNIYKESFNTAKDIEIYEGIRIQNSVHNIPFKTLVTKLENWDFIIPNFIQVYRWTEQQAEQLVISLLRGLSNTTNLLLYKQGGATSNPRWQTTSY